MLFANLLAVFLLSMLELWVAIPLGFALQLNPFWVAGISMAGGIWSVLFVIVAGKKAVAFLIKIRGGNIINEKGKAFRIWEKYGIPGLGLISPLLLGAPLGTAIGMALGSNTNKLVLWMGAGIIIWTVVLTVVLQFGLFSYKAYLM